MAITAVTSTAHCTTLRGEATLDNSGPDGSGEDDEGSLRFGSDSTQGGDSSYASSLAEKPKLGQRNRKSIIIIQPHCGSGIL